MSDDIDLNTLKEEIENIKAKNKELLDELKTSRSKLKKYEGIDPDEFSTLKTEKEKREEEEATKKGEFDKILKQKEEYFTRELEAAKKRASDLEARMVTERKRSAATAAITEAGGVAELLLGHVESRIKVEEVDGDFKVVVLGKDGNPLLTKKGEPASVAELVNEYKSNEVFGRAFTAPNRSGSGTNSLSAGHTSAAGMENPFAKGKSWNLTKQLELETAQPELAASLKALAASEGK